MLNKLQTFSFIVKAITTCFEQYTYTANRVRRKKDYRSMCNDHLSMVLNQPIQDKHVFRI